MAKRSFRVTGFTRFFLVMIIVAPLAYIGASYYNGEDGIENIKKLFNRQPRAESSEQQLPAANETAKPVNQPPSENVKASDLEVENKKLREELDFKSKRVEELYLENEELKRKMESLEKMLNETKKQ